MKVRYMLWKNMINRNGWDFRQAELTESLDEPENPGRGWYGIYTFMVEQSIDPVELRWSLRQGESLALVLLDIHAYRSKLLDEDALGNIRNILSFFMQYKKDVILRPVYDREGNGRSCEPDAFELVLEHMRQIGEILKSVKHSVFIFQGMLVGSWGEMHDSRYLTPEHLRKLYDTIKPCLDREIYLAVRTPAIWRTLTDEVQFGQGSFEKTAVFDDGILGSMTHLGTFGTMTRDAAGWEQAWTRKEELEFLEQITNDSPCGGEVVAGADGHQESAEFALRELKTIHLTYLNCVHDKAVLDYWKQICLQADGAWKESSLYDYIGAHLGYRLIVRSVEMKACLCGKWEMELEIENTGFAAPFQEMELFLVLEGEDGTWEFPVEFDVRQCAPGERKKIVQCFRTGRVNRMKGHLFLKLRRKKDGRPIRFANGKKADRLLLGSL